MRPAVLKPKPKKEPTFEIVEEYKHTVLANAYIGKKGYTISKSVLSKEDEAFLKKDLFLRPMVQGAQGYGPPEAAFPVYRENANKIYLPRFYGIQRYGLPDKCELDRGDDISVVFDKPLRDYQEKIIGIYTDYVNRPISAKSSTELGGGAILEVPCGRGKCLAKDTPVIMFDGSIKMVQDVLVGDLLMGDDSTPRTVLSLARGREQMYRVSSPNSGDQTGYVVNKSHILSLKNCKTNELLDISVVDYLRMNHRKPGHHYRGYRVPIEFPHREVPDDPYMVGVSLFSETGPKQIPPEYKCNSRDIQLGLFAGIIDTVQCTCLDGTHYEFAISSPVLYDDVVFLARSLGFFVEKCRGNVLRICIHPPNLLYDIKLECIGIDAYYGFEIDGNRRFLLGDATVTHNTIMALKIISLLCKKTLILVHKEFLMNQWIERIADFLPGARVGKIQGQTFDVEGKDIVIGMIQTLYDKELGANAFASFGLTIIDEVHRIGSEQFSKTLLRIITPYMLGISATVERKDGLTKVLNMFIGEKIYTEERENDDPVCVRGIEYVCADPEFNETVYDYRGNPQHSTMISKLCGYNRRSEFIVRVLSDLVDENPDGQIMILAQQRAILTYMHDAIVHRGFATVGYYVGGMKQGDLQTTESKQIVLATYAMAAEALDIKTLSILVMITPKTDIVQSVGRILRVKHANPIVVDIIDKHDVFQKQWAKRRRYYKKCGYRIRQIDSTRYNGMDLDWDTDTTWRRVFEPTGKSAAASSDSSDDEEEEAKPLSSRKCMIQLDDNDL